MVPFIMLYKEALTFVSLEKILNCEHSIDRRCEVIFPGALGVSVFCEMVFGIVFNFDFGDYYRP